MKYKRASRVSSAFQINKKHNTNHSTSRSDMRNATQVRLRWIRVLAFLVVFCYIIFLIEEQIRPVLRAIIEYESRAYAIISFNEAVQLYLAEYPDGYDALYQVTWDVDNVPTSVVANTYEINLARCALVQLVSAQLIQNKSDTYQFRLGRLSGVQFLATRGPSISLNMNPQSYVIADIYHTIESAGDNQTVLSVYATFTVQINVTMAGYIQTVTVENEVLLWQSLLLGRVPDVAL